MWSCERCRGLPIKSDPKGPWGEGMIFNLDPVLLVLLVNLGGVMLKPEWSPKSRAAWALERLDIDSFGHFRRCPPLIPCGNSAVRQGAFQLVLLDQSGVSLGVPENVVEDPSGRMPCRLGNALC